MSLSERIMHVVAGFGLGLICLLNRAVAAEVTPSDIGNAVTELDVERARTLAKSAKGAGAAFDFQRARLAVYVGDCDSAEAILATLSEQPEAANLANLARTCARATAGAVVVEDAAAGVWIRLQDAGDRALVPDLVRVAAAARRTMIEDLGVELPKPLRIDLVRDLFSLSAVSGLPLEAAETTGTVAVARWGRVTMLSPRAAMSGYPWEDTLAHEITHLALSRGSRDYAPLWLQEGIAKREETRWRSQRPFDERRNPHQIARRALLEGKSVGINQIGPSIAMLPTPEAAGIAYAEVESFMDYWIAQNGKPAFLLLLTELKVMQSRDADEVMASVTGYPFTYWIARWQEYLRQLPAPDEGEQPHVGRDFRQAFRVGDLVSKRGHVEAAERYFGQAHQLAPRQAAPRHRWAAAQLARGKTPEAVQTALGELRELAGLHGGWLGLHGQLLALVNELERAEASFQLGVAVDPYSVDVACGGQAGSPGHDVVARLPGNPGRQPLCDEARQLVGD
jgi:hypothetical protein